MTVNELIEQLKELPGDYRVILQSDPEGNSYRWPRGTEIGIPENPEAYRVSCVHSLDYTAYDVCKEEDEWEDMKKNAEKVVIIFP